jgi:multidrug transporter EmrE-like cation transporter
MHPMLLLALAIASEVAGTTSLKYSEGFTKLTPSVIVVVGYGLAFYLLSLSLKHIPLGTAYAIWSGVGTAATAVIGVLLWREIVDLPRVLGILLIIGGVVLLNAFSPSAGH